MLTNIGTLTKARDAAAVRVGILASQGPRWGSLEMSAAVSPTDLSDEAKRVYSVLCDVLDAQDQGLLTTKPGKVQSVGARRRIKGEVTPAALLQLIDGSLPRAEGILKSTLNEFGRPSKFTRLWFPLLFLPPAIYIAANSVVKNKEWLKEQVSNARETVKGFFVQWVWEPLEEIANTMRGGGKGLDVSPETVKTDQESLERMVMDLGRDYYHLSGSQLEQLKKQVASGDMSSVLKVYENEMQSPIKNALTGNLIRTLLIQVQKTKVGGKEVAKSTWADAISRPTCRSPSSLLTSSSAVSSSHSHSSVWPPRFSCSGARGAGSRVCGPARTVASRAAVATSTACATSSVSCSLRPRTRRA